MNNFKAFSFIIISIFMLLITGCGSSSSSTSVIQTSEVPAAFTGVAVDPYLSGAKFYYDLDNSKSYDEGEPLSTISDVSGVFTFENSVPQGAVIRMHPDFKGTHAGEDYTGEFLERVVNTFSETDGSYVLSPVTTMMSKYSISEDNMIYILNTSFEKTVFDNALLYSDPMKLSTLETATSEDFNNIQANIAISTFLSSVVKSNNLNQNLGILSKENISRIVKPVLKSVQGSLNQDVWTDIKNAVSMENIPELKMENYVLSVIKSNEFIVNDFVTAVENGVDSDLSTFVTSMESLITSKVTDAENSILKNTLGDYIVENQETLETSELFTNLITHFGAITENEAYFQSLTDDMPVVRDEVDSFSGSFKGGFPYLENAVFYIDVNNNGVFDSEEGSEEELSSAVNSNGEFSFPTHVLEGQTVRMYEYNTGEEFGVTYQGIPLERKIDGLYSSGSAIVTPFTTLVSRYNIDINDLYTILNTAAGGNEFAFYNIFTDVNSFFEDSREITAEESRKICVELGSSVILNAVYNIPEIDTFLKSLTSEQMTTLLTAVFTRIFTDMESVITISPQNYQYIITMFLANNFVSPADYPIIDSDILFKTINYFKKVYSKTIKYDLQVMDFSQDSSVVVSQICDVFSAPIISDSSIDIFLLNLFIDFYKTEYNLYLSGEGLLTDLENSLIIIPDYVPDFINNMDTYFEQVDTGVLPLP